MENYKHRMEMKELIERGESQSLEFKESLRLKDEIGETVSAFSNSDGGTVIVGVSDDGGVTGVDIGKNTLEELANHIKRNTDPQIFPTVKIQEVSGKKVVMIEVRESQEKPAFFKNHGYKNIYVEGGSTLNPRRHGFGNLGQAITYVSVKKPLFFFGIAGAVFTITGDLVVTFRKDIFTEDYLKNLGLNERQIKATEYLKINKTLTSKKYAELFSITDRMARNDLKELVNKKIIERKGVSDKTTYYILAEI
jgi:ATP-dependent DNA helicase RecG